MDKKIILVAGLVLLVVFGGAYFYMNTKSTAPASVAEVVTPVTQPTPSTPPIEAVATTSAEAIPEVATTTVKASSSVSLMVSTNNAFAQYQYASKAHEIFPVTATDLKTTMGAFSFSKVMIAPNVYKITLTNSAEGYKGQSVTVSSDQKVYFIERSTADDAPHEDSATADDMFIAVDAQGNILK
jgi:hypothetical protein